MYTACEGSLPAAADVPRGALEVRIVSSSQTGHPRRGRNSTEEPDAVAGRALRARRRSVPPLPPDVEFPTRRPSVPVSAEPNEAECYGCVDWFLYDTGVEKGRPLR